MSLLGKLFGHKDEDEQKKQQEAVRERGNTLLPGVNAAMDRAMAEGDRAGAQIAADTLFLCRNQLAALHAYLKAQPALRLDTADIDAALALIAEKVQEAVENDMPRTLEQGMNALRRGILTGRADIGESERAAMLSIIDERMKLLNALSAAVKAAMNIDNAEKMLRKAHSELAINQARLSALDDELAQHPEMDAVVRLLREPENEEEKEFLRRHSARAEINGLINGNEQIITLQTDTIDTSEIEIQQAEVAYLTISSQLKIDTTKEMEQMVKDVRQSMAENQDKLADLTRVTGEMNALFTSWQEPDFIRLKKVSAKLALEEDEAKKRRQERDRAAAEKLREQEEELRREQENPVAPQTNSNRKILTN